MLYDSIVRTLGTLVGQWQLVARSFENAYLDLRQVYADVKFNRKVDTWEWRHPTSKVSLLREQAEFVKTDPDVVGAAGAPDPGSLLARIESELTRLRAQLRIVENGPVPPSGDPLFPPGVINNLLVYIRGGFEQTLVALAAKRTDPVPGVATDFNTAFDFTTPADPDVGFPLFDPNFPPNAATNSKDWPQDDSVVALRLCRERLEDLERFIMRQLSDFAAATSNIGPNLNLHGIRSGIEDLGAYPLLTSDMGGGGYRSGGGGGIGALPSGTGSLKATVDSAIRNVLGRAPRTTDSRSFVAALKQSFESKTVNGTPVMVYQPRSFSGQTELGGGVTGAQASLYARASNSLDKALPLLEGLTPLDPAADDEDTDAMRAIVRNEFIQVVNELKAEGGPTTSRVDQLFLQLFGTRLPAEATVQAPLGHFGQLADLFGYDEDKFVNTLDEESNASNFIAVFEYAKQVMLGWVDFRDQFYGKDLGTRLVLLSRALSVASEAVQEVYAAMDSVFVGPAERQVASFVDPRDNRSRMLVSELLAWVTAFTTEEAPKMVLEGGRLGVAAIQPTAILLESLVSRMIEVIPTEPGLPKGLQHARVRFPLQELRGYLDQIQQLAEDVRKPLRLSK